MSFLFVRVRMGMAVGLSMRFAMMVARAVLVLMAGMPAFQRRIVWVGVAMGMIVVMPMFMLVFVVMSANSRRALPRQPASAFFTHYSISKEASSSSRPARISPLAW